MSNENSSSNVPRTLSEAGLVRLCGLRLENQSDRQLYEQMKAGLYDQSRHRYGTNEVAGPCFLQHPEDTGSPYTCHEPYGAGCSSHTLSRNVKSHGAGYQG